MRQYLCFLCIFASFQSTSSNNSTEKIALQSLYDATGGEYWRWDQSKPIWNFTDPNSDPCIDNWQGITCTLDDSNNFYISGLRLYFMNLVGALPSEMSLLYKLKSLDLSWNILISTLPSAMSTLTSLATMDISDNKLTGGIPASFSTFGGLTQLDASFNLFQDPPSALPYAGMHSLQSLKLNDNDIVGSIARDAFVNCTSLLQLNIYRNKITGSLPLIPSSLARFSMHENELSGTIPDSYFSGALEMLDLYINYITGSIPQSITNAVHLHFLSVDDNLVSGSLPSTWDPLTNFQALQAGDNFISGPIPPELFERTGLAVFMLLKNFATGSLPSITDLDGAAFDYFNVASNFITGSLPLKADEDILMLANNFFSGSIPTNFFTVNNDYIDVSNNILTGSMPSSLTGATGLYNLILSQNFFTGTIPASVYSVHTLAVLAFAENSISGTFPEMSALTKLSSLVVTDNHMHGSVPSLSAPVSLENLGFGHNLFTGSLPSDMVLKDVEFMSFTSNFFVGTLPAVYSTMRKLKVMDFSSNYLSGPFYADLSQNVVLRDVNTHFNRFEGSLPQRYGDSVVEFIMSSNNFVGSIPPQLTKLSGLMVLLLQDNQLSRSLDKVFSSNMTELRSIDLSDNAFTGVLPDALFQLPNIQTIALVKNCFRTKLPHSICESNSIKILALDGLAAGSECRNALWDPLSIFGDTYFIDHSQHTIPSCLFDMENLTTLHLSGNGLTGNIEHVKLKPSSKLTSLSLSHNQLTGTISQSVLNKALSFSEFDISYNRFSGTCDSNDVMPNKHNKTLNSIFSVEVNRLSGDIPRWMNRFADVRALSGNMFQCSKQSDLPSHDPDSDVYICGSGELDSALWVLLSACGTGIILAFYLLQLRNKPSDSSVAIAPQVTLYEWFMNPVLAMLRHVCLQFHCALSDIIAMKYVSESMQSIIPGCDVVIHVNLFVSASMYVLAVCRILLCAILCIVLPCILLLKLLSDDSERTQSHQYRWLISAAYMSGTDSAVVLFVLWAILVAVCVNMIYRRHVYIRQSMLARNMQATFGNATFTLQNIIDYIGVIILNMIVVFIVNGAYIYIQLKDVSQAVQIFSQVSLAGFKLVWDTFAVGAAISWISSRRKDNLDDRTLLYTALLVFNNIIAPCFVTAVTDDTCFKGLFEVADSVSVAYVNAQCSAYDVDYRYFVAFCSEYGSSVFTTSYIPPFNYNYQCSSAILKSFIPVFIYAYAFMILALPVMDVMICSVSVDRVPQLLRRNLAGVMWPSVTPDLDKPLIRVDRVISTLMRHLAVLLTFGFAFPLLGVGVVIAMIQYVWKWRLLIVRYVATISIVSRAGSSGTVSGGDAPPVSDAAIKDGADVDALMMKLNSDCKGSWRGAYICLWAVIWPGALFIGCLVFDILGDEVGWKHAIWILLLTLLLPLVYVILLKLPYVRSIVLFGISSDASTLDDTTNPLTDLKTLPALDDL